jgi:hypothetical protein
LYVNSEQTPKLGPPPLIPQNKSEFSFSDAVTTVPLTNATLADTRLSTVWPYSPVGQPEPPPRVKPPIPEQISMISMFYVAF